MKSPKRFLLLSLASPLSLFIPLALMSAPGVAATPPTLPTLPQKVVNTKYVAQSGQTIVVNAGGDLQAAINAAARGDTIVLQAGATYPGPFTLPNKTAGAGWIYITSSAYANLPSPGKRVTVADAANMPKITVAANKGAAIQTKAKAHHFRFVGIEFKPQAGNFVYALIQIGNRETVTTALPRNITFDRCYIHGDPDVGARRGVAMDGINVAVVDSHVSDFKENGSDTQALWAYNTPGPLKVLNNYLEASGENLMTGGSDPGITDLVPSDIEIKGNHFFKPLTWIGQQWTVKNLLEFKNGQRILVEGNVFENNWLHAQDGEAIVITPRNQGNHAPWSATRDITVRLNKIVNVGRGFNVSGRDSDYQSQVAERVLIENNVISVTALQGATGRIIQVVGGPVDVTVRHNTAFTVPGGTLGFSENRVLATRFDFRDNIMSRGSYGFAGTGTGEGTRTLDAYYTDYTFVRNAVIGADLASYPADNRAPASMKAVGFVDSAAQNYRLAATSPYKSAATDGKDMGADIDAIEAATAGVAPAP
jgi:hypothetical protein